MSVSTSDDMEGAEEAQKKSSYAVLGRQHSDWAQSRSTNEYLLWSNYMSFLFRCIFLLGRKEIQEGKGRIGQ